MRTDALAEAVRVLAPARLHLGFLDLNGSLGRRYGSLGLALDRPATALTVTRAPQFRTSGFEQDRALKLLHRFGSAFGLSESFAVNVTDAIPAHAGLGSGTQLALAIGQALRNMCRPLPPGPSLGELAERGARSAIGMAAFQSGGFIIDGGRAAEGAPPPVIIRLPVPEAWRVLLVLDRSGEGVHGDKEAKAFANLRPFPDAAAGHLCRLAMMRLAPGLAEHDFPAFGAAVTEIQAIVGEHFAAFQGGGPWSQPAVGRIVQRLGEAGAAGLGQSSWGPTGFAFAETEDAAQRLYQSAAEAARAEGLEIVIARGRNEGARVETLTTAELGA